MAIVVAVGSSSRSTSNRLGPISTFKVVTPVRLPPGRFRLATSPSWSGSPPVRKTIGIVGVACCEVLCRDDVAAGCNYVYGTPNEICRQRLKPIVLAIGPAVFNDHIPALNVARFIKAKAKCAHNMRELVRRC